MPGEPPTHWIGSYGFYSLERVGLASGFKHFGTHDWYKEGAGLMVGQQAEDGHWGKPFQYGRVPIAGDMAAKPETPQQEQIVEAAFCLLFLSRGRHPILMAKLRFDGLLPAEAVNGLDIPGGVKVAVNAKASDMWTGYWNNRPRDVANLNPLRLEAARAPVQLGDAQHRARLDRLAGRPGAGAGQPKPAPEFTQADIEKLRNYVQAGGLLFTHSDGSSPQFNKYAATLAHQLFPQYEMVDVPPGHPLYTNDTVFNVNPRPPLKMVSNGSRVLMLHSPTDITRWWQMRDDVRHRAEFGVGVNMFVYAAGKQDFRNRLQQAWVAQAAG